MAWQLLLKQYRTAGSINSVIMTLCEIFDSMDSNGLYSYDKMPLWMELALASLVQTHGIRNIAGFCHA